ncbi:MAG TPA: deiodinase-like protein [Flavobacteriales bacterium]
MRHLALLFLALPFSLSAQLQNWNPDPYRTDSALIFRDDLDYYLNGYSKEEIQAMRKQVSIWRMNWDKVIKATIDDIRSYSEGNGMDVRTHDFTLVDARTGLPYHLQGRTGRIRAFMFGSLTNPPARMQLPYWDRLRTKYDTSKVDLLVIYGKELHPGDKKEYKNYPAPKSEYEKVAYAKEFAQLTKLPVLVDGLNNATLEQYGKVPNGAYVVDADGRLIFRGTWADSRKVEHIIDTVLKWYAEGRPPAAKAN